MPNITLSEVRQKYPDYDHLSDEELADKLHTKFYSQLPKEEFNKRIGFNQEKQPEERSFLSKLVPNLVSGLAEGGHGLVNTGIKFYNATQGPYFGNIPQQKDYDYSEMLGIPQDQKTFSDKAVQSLSQFLPGLTAPEMEIPVISKALTKIPMVGKLLNKVFKGASPIAAYSTTQAPQGQELDSAKNAAEATVPFSMISHAVTSTNPYVKILGMIASAGAGAYGGKKLSDATGLSPGISELLGAILGASAGRVTKSGMEASARDEALKGVEGTNYKQKLEALRRLDIDYGTPGEMSGNPFTAATQGASGKTEKGAQLLYEKGQKRVKSETEAINNLFDEMYNKEKLDPDKKYLYKLAYTKYVPKDFVDEFKDNEIIKTAIKRMDNKSAFRESLKDVPKDSIGYWDHVKKSLGDMVKNASKKPSNEEAAILKQTQDNLIRKMDIVAPEYKKARELAEREINLRKIKKSLNNDELRGTNFFNKILKNDIKFNELREHFKSVPSVQQKLDDMKLIFKDFINPPTVRTAAGLANTGMRQERNTEIRLANRFKELISGGRYDEAMIKIITNPKWDEELKNIGKISNFREKLGKTVDLLGRVAGAKAGQSIDKEDQQ